jgi:hypothetical protein
MAIRAHFDSDNRRKLTIHLSGWLAGLCTAAALTALSPAPANAANNIVGQSQSGAPASSGSGQYFIEFRSRYAWDYGHTFLVHGRVGERLTKASVAGLSPVGDDSTAWVIGHYVPVPAETGWTDGDLEDKYISARYRVYMNKEQYDSAMVYIKELQGRSKVWSAELYNCNAFVGDVARHIGIKVPASSLIYPRIFINNMRKINTQPNAPDTLISDNVKEMSSPVRDGRAMINSGVYTAQHALEEVKRPASAPSGGPSVIIGPIRVSNSSGGQVVTSEASSAQ